MDVRKKRNICFTTDFNCFAAKDFNVKCFLTWQNKRCKVHGRIHEAQYLMSTLICSFAWRHGLLVLRLRIVGSFISFFPLKQIY